MFTLGFDFVGRCCFVNLFECSWGWEFICDA
jgi:hypothetical protein